MPNLETVLWDLVVRLAILTDQISDAHASLHLQGALLPLLKVGRHCA
jgi:hypothetical protein